MTLYQIDPRLAPDDPYQELVKQWIGTLLKPVDGPVYRINYDSPNYSPILDDWIERAVLVEVGEDSTP